MTAESYVTTVTPFNNRMKVDTNGIKKIVKYITENGIKHIIPLGTTGEFSTLTLMEKKEVINTTINAAGSAEVIPNISSTSFKESIELCKYYKEIGISSVLLLPPYYFKSKGEGFKRFIEEVISQCDVKIWIYNNPLQTGVELNAEDMLDLSKYDAIIGFKDASPNLLALRKFVMKRDESKKILGGLEEYGFYSLLLRSDGFTSSIGNFIPQLPLNICNRFNEGNLVEANRLNTILVDYRTYMLESNQPVMMHFAKIGLKKIGLIEHTIVRPPLSNISEEQNKIIEKVIDQIFQQIPDFQ